MPRTADGPLSAGERNALLTAWLAAYPRPVGLLTAKRRGLVRRCYAAGLTEDEVNSACLLGAVLAARKFDPARGVKFNTYAGFWVIAYAQQALKAELRRVRACGGVPPDEVPAADSGRTAWDDEEVVHRALAVLPSRERLGVALYFGLGGLPQMTQREVGERLGLSRCWVSAVVLPRLRRAVEAELGRA